MFHISKKKLKENELVPKIPNNFFTKNDYEEKETKRICFCPTISQCLMAMARCIKGETFYVYKIEEGQEYAFISNKEIVEKDMVPDAYITKEMWVLTEVKVKLVKIIKVSNASEEKIRYVYDIKKNKEAELYEWNWKEKKIKNKESKQAGLPLIKKKRSNKIGKDYITMQMRQQMEATKHEYH